ncbi:MAG: hypothetical protein ACLR7U_14050 [Ruthenibacterium lactatiformans]
MASIRKRGNGYLIVVYGLHAGRRRRKQTNKANRKPLSEATVKVCTAVWRHPLRRVEGWITTRHGGLPYADERRKIADMSGEKS